MGHQYQSSVFELQINDPETFEPITDRKTLMSIGVGLRSAIAEKIGVGENEIGVISESYRDTSDRSLASIFIYDTASQGAGFGSEFLNFYHFWASA